MSIIEVDHSTLRYVSAAIHTYCAAQDREMKIADTEIRAMLSNGWIGQDALEFGRKWEGVNESGSVTVNFRESLKNFADALIACSNEYQSAQSDTVNAAGRLMRLVGR
jgi:hypothetical protein